MGKTEKLKAIIKKKEKEEKIKNNEIGSKLIHESLNINKKSFYPKNYFSNKSHNNLNTDENINPMINKNSFYNFNINTNNMNTIGNKTFSGHFYYSNNNNFNNPSLVNNAGWLYNNEDNTYYFDPPDENNSSNNFYYVINRFQDFPSSKNFHQSK